MSYPQRVSLIDPAQDALSIRQQVKLLEISRSSVYYEPGVDPEDVRLMHAIDKIYTDKPFYGSRRMRWALANVHHIHIGRDQVRRLMRRMGLEAIYPKPKRFLSAPDAMAQKYPYLLRNLAVTHPNHVWGTDITYVRLAKNFCYLVALMDWYSRYVIAWQLSPVLEIDFCLENLERAFGNAVPEIHNSDQGSHFTSPQYTKLLQEKNVQISMDGRGRCMDNIFTERLWRSVKYEDIYIHSYENFREAHKGLSAYFAFYNTQRPHQSLQYRTPAAMYFKK